jgi:multiple sugar transport system substrate-binding protein
MAARRAIATIGSLALCLAAAACGGGGGSASSTAGKPAASSDPKAEIVVWTDGTRAPMIKAYQDAHPDVKVKSVTIPQDTGYVSTKVQLANRSKQGWPDVVFLADSGEIAALAAPPFDFATPLNDLVPQKTRDDFAPGTISNCTFADKTYCLQNDIAQTVLWYNKQLMKDFGYEVPKTWADYQALGQKVAKEHPGYVIGAMGDHIMLNVYYYSSGCPMRDVKSIATVHIDAKAPQCTRVNSLLQPLIDNKTLPLISVFDPPFAALGTSNKILMLPGASWMGDFVFKTTYKTPKGQLAAAPMPTWKGEDKAYSGAVGGGVWAVSKHAKNTQGAVDMITWLTTDVGIQTKQPTYPASKTAAAAWSTQKAADAFYAENPVPVFQQQAPLIRDNWKFVRYQATATNRWNELVVAGLKQGKRLDELVPLYGDEIVAAAKKAGYTVE